MSDDFKARKIRVYRNGDTHYVGKRMVVNGRVFKNFEQFLLVVSDEVRLMTGAVRRLVEMETGASLRSLNDVKDGTFYVATSGEPYRKVAYVVTDENGLPLGVGSQHNLAPLGVQRPSETRQTRRKVNRSTGGLLDEEIPEVSADEPIFGPTSKAYRVIVFENGEFSDPGFKLILNYRNCRSFEQLLRHLSSHMYLKTGQVKKLYDAHTGRRIRSLKDITPGQNLVAATYEQFKMVPYRFQDLNATPHVIKKETEAPKIVTFYPNGDSYHTGLTVTVVKKRFPTLSRLVDTLNTQIELVTGKIQKLYALDGSRITSIEELVSGKGYVMVANDDPFIKTRYNVLAIKSHRPAPVESEGGRESVKHAKPATSTRVSKAKPVGQTQPLKPPAPVHQRAETQNAAAKPAKPVARLVQQQVPAPVPSQQPKPVAQAKNESIKQKPNSVAGSSSKPVSRNGLKTPGSVYEEEIVKQVQAKEEVYGGEKVQELSSKKDKAEKDLKQSKQPQKQQDKPSTAPKKPKTPKSEVQQDEIEEQLPSRVASPSQTKPKTPKPEIQQDIEEKLPSRVASPSVSAENPKTASKNSANVSDYSRSKRQQQVLSSEELKQNEADVSPSPVPDESKDADEIAGEREREPETQEMRKSQSRLKKHSSRLSLNGDESSEPTMKKSPSQAKVQSKPGTAAKLQKSPSQSSITKTVSLTFEPPAADNSASR